MRILGLKLSHDAGVAAFDGDQCLFSIEMEKVGNNPRYTAMPSWEALEKVLGTEGLSLSDFDTIVVDGWKYGFVKQPQRLDVAPYHEYDGKSHGDPLLRHVFHAPRGVFRGHSSYASYHHMTGHIMGAYATSPFSEDKVPAAVITWDGGQNARAHYVHPQDRNVMYIGSLIEFYGILYSLMGYYFGPYRKESVVSDVINPALAEDNLFGAYEWPGKLMAYIGSGEVHEVLLSRMRAIGERLEAGVRRSPARHRLDYNQNGIIEHEFMRGVVQAASKFDLPPADVLLTLHTYLERLLVERAMEMLPKGIALCFAGGSALNIKWNSALRECGHFSDVWVPPFPNDAGSAFGAACCELAREHDIWSVKWSAYSGPKLIKTEHRMGWSRTAMQPHELGWLLAEQPEEPVVVLHGRAEVGPRALGHRSIMMSPRLPENKERLNKVKGREGFRPVAPICLEEYAPEIFLPGTPDPHMLFDHSVRASWLRNIPAVVHIDETARLQTINRRQCPTTYAILSGHHLASGIPLVCNTSANHHGTGFFPSIADAQAWAVEHSVKYVWADGYLFARR